MAFEPGNFHITTVGVTNVAPTDVIAPIDCNHVIVDNGDGETVLTFWRNKADDATKRTILPGAEFAIAATFESTAPRFAERGSRSVRFPAGAVVGALQDAVGARNVGVLWVR